jgi:putative ABC transport system permease protein
VRAAAALLREAVDSARSQPVASVLSVAMVAGMCVAVLLTTGRTVAAEQAALAQIDTAGTRSIIVRADPGAGVTAGVLDRVRALEGVEAVTGLGPITDARNAAAPGGTKVAVRNGYGVIAGEPLLAIDTPTSAALASPAATRTLGLRDGTGGLVTDDGYGAVVVGEVAVPPHLGFLEPLVLMPSSSATAAAGEHPDDPLTVLVVLAQSPPEVATVRSLLPPADPASLTVETSAELAAIRAAVGGELGSHGRATVLGILVISVVLVAVNLLALVTMRRKDFGRRRALGATQSLIVALLLGQLGLLATIGAAVGVAAALLSLAVTGDPLPGARFTLAVAVAGVLTAMLGALPPAILAARRDPLHELRVP